MILNKIFDKNNTKLISEKYLEWIDSGVLPSDILVLTFNSTSKKNIIKNILDLSKKNTFEGANIYTTGGLIYNSVINNWNILENKIKTPQTCILPNLSGMEISQHMLKEIIKNEDVKGYNSKKSLLHQIFRRFSLIVNNNLTPEEVKKKSEIIGEAFSEDAEKIIQKLMAKTIEKRAFDNIRQTQIFSYIYKNTDYFKNIKYLIAEDVDEYTPVMLDFIESLSPQIKDKLIILDKDGGSRRGFLCADSTASERLEKIFNEEILSEQETPQNIRNLEKNILNDEKNDINNLQFFSLSKRLEMVEKATNMINEIILSGVAPCDISIVTPIHDKLLQYALKTTLKNCSPLFISGNEKLSENPLVKTVLSIIKLTLEIPLDEYDLRIIISKYIGIPIKNSKTIIENYISQNKVLPIDFEDSDYKENLKKFCNILNNLNNSKMSLSEKAYHIYVNYQNFFDKHDLSKFNFFLKELQDFEKIYNKNDISEKDIILQIENSIISENPYSILEINENDLVVATPQKIIDNKIETKYQFWLDVSSKEWVKADIGPLYNSWVFQKNWDKNDYTIDDNIQLSKEKTSKILRKLMLNSEKIIAFSSLFDTQGSENIGGIEKYLISTNSKNQCTSNFTNIIKPREDQKPVLEYSSGKMSISAVPGAGKTTILLALIIKLLEKNIEPENIYVLTYMESAARNFKERIKGINEDSNKMPNISTIHGLALRILKENSNFERLGLNPDFEICDDTQRSNILRQINKDISKQYFDDFDRGISILKLSGIETDLNKNNELARITNFKKGTKNELKLSSFIKFFADYQEKLKQNNLIDYDDILILSVKLLKENPDILDYYQNICKYIIEDEAQDSSSVQQELISLLSAKHGNLIRCGDINQAITTTFTNADTEGFRHFIKNSNCVKMDHSQRCSKGVMELANTLIKLGNNQERTPFYEIYMNPVEGKNPIETSPINSNIFEKPQEEKIKIVKTIKSLLSKNPQATIGILLRNNYQVNTWADYINNSGLTAITRNECLGQKKIFKVILSVLNFISNPFDNICAANAYRMMAECGIFKPNIDKIMESLGDELKGEKIDFISLDNDEIFDADMARFHWDMNYWLSFPELTVEELAIRIGLNYFSKNIDRSNIHLIATLCAKIDNGNFSQTVKRLEELSKRPNLSGFKFFSEEEEENLTEGKIQIMTLHKSKGDEFDYVFLPEMNESNLPLDKSTLKLKNSNEFEESIRRLNKNYAPKTEDKIKTEILNENYRLLYVALTRAKRRLYISTSKKEAYYNKLRDSEPSIIFSSLLENN